MEFQQNELNDRYASPIWSAYDSLTFGRVVTQVGDDFDNGRAFVGGFSSRRRPTAMITCRGIQRAGFLRHGEPQGNPHSRLVYLMTRSKSDHGEMR